MRLEYMHRERTPNPMPRLALGAGGLRRPPAFGWRAALQPAGSRGRTGADNTRSSTGSACSRRSSPRQRIACRVETASIHMNGGATSSNRRNRSKPTGSAAAATLASMTSLNVQAATTRRPRPSSARGCHPRTAGTRAATATSDTSHPAPHRARRDRSAACAAQSRPAGGHRVPSDAPSTALYKRRRSACRSNGHAVSAEGRNRPLAAS
jgi:hypothetical protein